MPLSEIDYQELRTIHELWTANAKTPGFTNKMSMKIMNHFHMSQCNQPLSPKPGTNWTQQQWPPPLRRPVSTTFYGRQMWHVLVSGWMILKSSKNIQQIWENNTKHCLNDGLNPFHFFFYFASMFLVVISATPLGPKLPMEPESFGPHAIGHSVGDDDHYEARGKWWSLGPR